MGLGRERLLYLRCIGVDIICRSRQVFEMETKKKLVITPGKKLAIVMAAAVFCVMLLSAGSRPGVQRSSAFVAGSMETME